MLVGTARCGLDGALRRCGGRPAPTGPKRSGGRRRTGFLLREVNSAALAVLPWPYLFHVVFGMTIFLLFPFSRLVHVWSGFASVAYLFRPYQVVRSRRLGLPGDKSPSEPQHVKKSEAPS